MLTEPQCNQQDIWRKDWTVLQPSIMILQVLLNHKKQRAQNLECPVLLEDKSAFTESSVFYLELAVSPQASMFLSNYRSRRFWNSLILFLSDFKWSEEAKRYFYSQLWTGQCIVYAVPHLYVSKSRIFKYERIMDSNNQMQNLLFLKIKWNLKKSKGVFLSHDEQIPILWFCFPDNGISYSV